MVYVIVVEPIVSALIKPLVGFTVATAGVADDHVPPAIDEFNVLVPPRQIAVVPVIVPALGAAVTVTVAIADAFAQPPVPVTV